MTSDKTNSKQGSFTSMIYRFLGGATVGTLILLLPITYGKTSDFGLVQVGAASALVLSCGLLSAVFGARFVGVVTRMLNNTGL